MGLLDISTADICITDEYLKKQGYRDNGFGIYSKSVDICSCDFTGLGYVEPIHYKLTTFTYQYNICTKCFHIIVPVHGSWWFLTQRCDRGKVEHQKFYDELHSLPTGCWITLDCLMFQKINNEFDLELIINYIEQLAINCNITFRSNQ